MSELNTIKIEIKDLFLARFKNKWNDFNKVVTQESIDFQKKWNNYDVEIISKLDLPDYSGIELTRDSRSTSHCNIQEWYTLTSSRELNDDDFTNFRALNLFLHGQETGRILKAFKENDKFIYKLKSECDSSD
jgi:hypothetical protein